ncbi:MAG: hypothetical protein HQK52_19615 [Oligoflexia bacterium]|nr:hypothetical protein [Oligoflexia bacterium]
MKKKLNYFILFTITSLFCISTSFAQAIDFLLNERMLFSDNSILNSPVIINTSYGIDYLKTTTNDLPIITLEELQRLRVTRYGYWIEEVNKKYAGKKIIYLESLSGNFKKIVDQLKLLDKSSYDRWILKFSDSLPEISYMLDEAPERVFPFVDAATLSYTTDKNNHVIAISYNINGVSFATYTKTAEEIISIIKDNKSKYSFSDEDILINVLLDVKSKNIFDFLEQTPSNQYFNWINQVALKYNKPKFQYFFEKTNKELSVYSNYTGYRILPFFKGIKLSCLNQSTVVDCKKDFDQLCYVLPGNQFECISKLNYSSSGVSNPILIIPERTNAYTLLATQIGKLYVSNNKKESLLSCLEKIGWNDVNDHGNKSFAEISKKFIEEVQFIPFIKKYPKECNKYLNNTVIDCDQKDSTYSKKVICFMSKIATAFESENKGTEEYCKENVKILRLYLTDPDRDMGEVKMHINQLRQELYENGCQYLFSF